MVAPRKCIVAVTVLLSLMTIITDVMLPSIENELFSSSNSEPALVSRNISQGFFRKDFSQLPHRAVHHSTDEEAESQRRLSHLPKEPSFMKGRGAGTQGGAGLG